jgi:Na+-translocating ferredoxin:NAD+ oxidoreductase subunit G
MSADLLTTQPPAAAGPGAPPDGGDAPPAPVEVQPVRLILTLALAGALAGLLLVTVFQWAEPRIQAHQAAALRNAILEVLHGPDSYRTLYVVDGALTEALPAGADSLRMERVFLGFDDAGAPVGYAITGGEPGFQDIISIIFGYDAATGEVLAMKVLDHKETPGLGDKIEKDQGWLAAFHRTPLPLRGVKAGAGSGAAGEVDMITGVTISSRTIISTINNRVERLQPLLDAYVNAPERAAGQP